MADEGWCHVVCALWTPGITFGEAEKLEPVVGVKEIVASRPPTKCEFCEKEGQCLVCDEPECERTFHPLCGLEKGNTMTAVLDRSDMRVLLTTKCSHHSKPLTPEELFLQLTPDLWHDPTLIAHRFGRRLRRELDRARNTLWLVVRREKMKRKLIRTTNEFFDQEIADWEKEKEAMLQEEKRRKKDERDAKRASYLLSLGTRTSRHRPSNDDRDVEGSSNNSIATTKPNARSERGRHPSGADAGDDDGGVANDQQRRTGDARPSRLSLKRKSTDSAVESSGDHSSTRRNRRQSVDGNGQRTLDNFFGSSSDSSVKKTRTPTSPSKERIPRALADILPSPVKPKKSPNQHPPDSPPRGKRLSASHRGGSNRLSLRKR